VGPEIDGIENKRKSKKKEACPSLGKELLFVLFHGRLIGCQGRVESSRILGISLFSIMDCAATLR
jgi:ssDNA-binding Zn-finger/Zn-ribbon topoisomerase 1